MDEIIDFPDQPAPIKRPLAITIACVINWAAGLFSCIAFVYVGYIDRVTPKTAAVFAYSLVCIALCMALWHMKRWAAIAYIISCIGMILITLSTGIWVDAVVIPIASLLVIIWYIKTFKTL